MIVPWKPFIESNQLVGLLVPKGLVQLVPFFGFVPSSGKRPKEPAELELLLEFGLVHHLLAGTHESIL